MALTKENITFIDTYLENSDVNYIDIRLEMIDHVASEIEQQMENGDEREFYFIFKDYMVKNKHKLLNNNRIHIKNTDNRLTKNILKTLLTWPCAFTFFGLWFLFISLDLATDISVLKTWVGVLPLIGFVIFGIIYFIKLKWQKLERFSAIERIGFIYAMAFNIFHLSWNVFHLKSTTNTIVLYAISSFALTLLLAMVLVTQKMIKENQERFKQLA